MAERGRHNRQGRQRRPSGADRPRVRRSSASRRAVRDDEMDESGEQPGLDRQTKTILAVCAGLSVPMIVLIIAFSGKTPPDDDYYSPRKKRRVAKNDTTTGSTPVPTTGSRSGAATTGSRVGMTAESFDRIREKADELTEAHDYVAAIKTLETLPEGKARRDLIARIKMRRDRDVQDHIELAEQAHESGDRETALSKLRVVKFFEPNSLALKEAAAAMGLSRELGLPGAD